MLQGMLNTVRAGEFGSRAPFIRPAELVSVAQVLHVLERLPNRSAAMTVSIGLRGPRRCFGEH